MLAAVLRRSLFASAFERPEENDVAHIKKRPNIAHPIPVLPFVRYIHQPPRAQTATEATALVILNESKFKSLQYR